MAEPNRHFGVCMACGCIQEPRGFFGDEKLNRSIRYVNAAFEKESQPGVQRKFLTQGMEESHYIQKANAWLAVNQWLSKTHHEAFRDERVTFDNTKRERESSQADFTSSWDCPEPIRFDSLEDFVLNWLSGRGVPNTGYMADNDRTAHCCNECNDFMDVRGWTTHLLWAVAMREGTLLKGVNPRDGNDNGAGRLIPVHAITIARGGVPDVHIPRDLTGAGHTNERGHFYTATLSYFIHRCVRGLVALNRRGHTIPRTQMNLRIYAIVPVLALKLLCLKKEYVQRWSPANEDTRSPHNYVGLLTLYVSYAMYMLYVCDVNVSKIPFDSFHLFYMRELPYAPKWPSDTFPIVWRFVLREDELDDNVANTTEQVQRVVKNLVDLYREYVAPLLAVIHPTVDKYRHRLSLQEKTAVDRDGIPYFVNQHEMRKLRQLNDLANTKRDSLQFSLYVMMIGIAPIAMSIRRMFCDDSPSFLEVLDRWKDGCFQDEYGRISEKYQIDEECARTLYHMCCIPLKTLWENDVLLANQTHDDVARFSAADFARCKDAIQNLGKMSVWKSALILREHGILITRRSTQRVVLPPKDPEPIYMRADIGLASGRHPILNECFSMRTGCPLRVSIVSL